MAEIQLFLIYELKSATKKTELKYNTIQISGYAERLNLEN